MVMTFTCNYRLYRWAGWSALRPAIFYIYSAAGTNLSLVKKDVDVNRHERLSNITNRYKLK